MESLRNQDMKAEQGLGEFMDAYFYSKLEKENREVLKCKRMSDKESQMSGIDVCIVTTKRKIFIDEKAAIYYSNAMIPTFAFEIDSIQTGHIEPIQGWFVNDELQTQYYMLIWTNVKCIQEKRQWKRIDVKNLKKTDFTIVEAMLISKSDIRRALEKEGFDKGRLVEYAKRLRASYIENEGKHEKKISENAKILLSGQLAEKPVNVVVHKRLLGDLAKRIYLISPDGYASIKG